MILVRFFEQVTNFYHIETTTYSVVTVHIGAYKLTSSPAARSSPSAAPNCVFSLLHQKKSVYFVKITQLSLLHESHLYEYYNYKYLRH